MKKRFISFFKETGIWILLAASVYFGMKTYQKPHLSAKTAPNFEMVTIDDFAVRLEELRGQYVVLDFWASWCQPCRRANPQLVKLYNTFRQTPFQDASDFVVVSISLDRSRAAWLEAVKTDNLSWDYHAPDLDKLSEQPISEIYEVDFIPASFFIAPDGKIIGINWSAKKIARFLNKKKQ